MAPAPLTRTRPSAEARCPTCGAPAERGQLVCLECGGRIALDYRRPPGWKLPVAIVGGVVIVAVAAFALLLSDVGKDAESEVARTPARGPRREAAPPRRPPARERTTAAKGARPAPRTKAPRRRPEPAPVGGVAGWPRRNAFTVVLLSAGDRDGALQIARSLRRDGVKAGVLRADDYSSLTPGFWLVFSGQYRTRAQADKAAGRLRGRVSGAYVQFVNGAERR